MAQALRDAGLVGGSIVEGGISAALKQVELGTPRILLVDVSSTSTPVQDVAALAAIMEPGTRLIVIGATNDVALFRDLLGVGASDYLVKPLDVQHLHAALSDGSATKAGQAPAKIGRVAAVVGARGGVGATTVAVNTAYILSHERKQRTALVDLDLHFGTTALALDIEPGRGLRDALEKPGRIDSLFLERAMAKIGDRLFVLGCEEPLRERPSIDPGALETVLGELRQNFSWIVLDMPRWFVATQPHAFTAVTDILLMCDQSLAGIRDAMRLLDLIKESAPQARLKLASASTDGANPKIARADFEKSIGRKIDFEIPFEAKTVTAGANAGKPLSA
ncbi:MAG TPA: AAA family ATPase, partial [Alphaproteobacteria bacterium]|nr:AAA family ATPase [Alphaproteobacteria bacterium]